MDKEKKNLLVFGYGLAVIFLFFCIKLTLEHGMGPVSVFFGLISVIFLFLTFTNHAILRTIYDGWMFVAVRIGHVVSNLILAVLFYGIFMPMSLILRLLQKDMLDRAVDKTKTSYWVKRSGKPPGKESYTKQY